MDTNDNPTQPIETTEDVAKVETMTDSLLADSSVPDADVPAVVKREANGLPSGASEAHSLEKSLNKTSGAHSSD